MQGEQIAALLLQGLLVGSVPVALVWALRGQHLFAKLASVTAFATFDLVVFGAFTRLTDSGLGCPDWPGCFAKANPLAAAADINRAALLDPGGPVDLTKAWIEMVHRSFAMGIGVLILTLLFLSFRRRHGGRIEVLQFRVAVVSLLTVLLQGAFGAWTVTLKLWPIVVLSHLMLGLTLLGVLTFLAALANTEVRRLQRATVALWARRLAVLTLLIVVVQIFLGGWVSTNYAVLACADFPRCQGHWLPSMDFADGFSMLHPLGRTRTGDAFPVDALTAIHWTHRCGALVVTMSIAMLAAGLRQTPLRREVAALCMVLLLQLLTGIANVVLGWPLFAAVLHNAGAAALVAILVLVNYRIRLIPLAAHDSLALKVSALS
jgi:cytochrome c oxidase assembly protein subunit 15